MAKENPYDTTRMAEIIVYLIENFGKDSLIKYLLERLIRKWSDSLVPPYKSTKVVELEKKYGLSLSGLSRKQIYSKSKAMSKSIVIEHGLPEAQAIAMFFEKPTKENVKTILEDVNKNLVYITKEEHGLIGKGERSKGESGYYWEDTYKKANIELEKNNRTNDRRTYRRNDKITQRPLNQPITNSLDTITKIKHRCIIIKIKQTTVDARGSVYEAVSHCWKASKDRAEQADYVLAVINGIVNGVFEPNNWYCVDEEKCNEINCGIQGPCGRIAFDGCEADNDIKKCYLNKYVPEWFRRPGPGPFLYTF